MNRRNTSLKQRVSKLEDHHSITSDTLLMATVDETGHITLSGHGYIPNTFYTYQQIEDLMSEFDYYNVGGAPTGSELDIALNKAGIDTIIYDDMAYVYRDTDE